MFWSWSVLLLLALAEGLHSLREGRRQLRSWAGAAASGTGAGNRNGLPAAILVPCRGLDPGFEENMQALFRLESLDFELLFIVDRASDPARESLERLCRAFPAIRAQILVAGPAEGCGQKVHNLRFAVDHLPAGTRTLVFADSDIRPLPNWLEALIGALEHRDAGLASGFRWYLPAESASAATILRSAWNGGILSVMRPEGSLFGWGGALACSRRVFEECHGRESWAGSLSDDYSLSAAARRCGYQIRFVPGALSPSPGHCSLRELLNWTARQIKITRVYHPGLWKLTWASQMLYGAAVWGTAALVAVPRAFSGLDPGERFLLAGLGLAIAALSGLKARWRVQAVAAVLPEESDRILRYTWWYAVAPPLCNLITVQGLARSLLSRHIEWRGIRYQMVSPRETRILGRDGRESGRDTPAVEL